jgi:hypothetical protein
MFRLWIGLNIQIKPETSNWPRGLLRQLQELKRVRRRRIEGFS